MLEIAILVLIIVLSFVTGYTVNNKERLRTEKRALQHFSKLMKIENVLEDAKRTKEPSVFTIDKIKNVIYSGKTNR